MFEKYPKIYPGSYDSVSSSSSSNIALGSKALSLWIHRFLSSGGSFRGKNSLFLKNPDVASINTELALGRLVKFSAFLKKHVFFHRRDDFLRKMSGLKIILGLPNLYFLYKERRDVSIHYSKYLHGFVIICIDYLQ